MSAIRASHSSPIATRHAGHQAKRGCRVTGGILGFVAAAGLALSSSTYADDVLNLYDGQLVTYQASPTGVQDLAPRAGQRGVHLDGSGRAGGLMGGIVPGHSGSDLGFNSKRLLGGHVDLFTGSVQVTDVDLAFPADPGGNWVIGRTYNTRQDDSGHHVSQGPQGNNWAMANPEITLFEGATDDLDVLYLVGGADRYAAFKRIGASDDEFQGINGATGVVQYAAGAGSEPDTYTLTQPDGTRLVFFGFDGDSGVAAGQLWKKIGPDGATAFVGDATTGSTAIALGFDTAGGTNLLSVAYDASDNGGRRFTYTYDTGRVTRVKVEICATGNWSSPGALTTVGQVDYGYYGAMESYGSEWDLKSVTVTIPTNEASVDLVTRKYYRYWTGSFNDSTNPGHPSALQYIVEAEGYRQADLAGDSTFDDDPMTMSETALKPYAAAYFEYNSSRQVDKSWFNGRCGCSGASNGEHEITYGTTGSEASPYDDAWKRRAIVDQPDELFISVLFDEAGQVVGEAKTEGNPSGSPTNTWGMLAVRGSDALIDEIATPANITGYTHSTGAFTRSTSVGLVRVVDRVSSGVLTGFIEGYEYKAGSTGTSYVERQMDYETRGLTIGSATLDVPFVDAQRSVFADNETSGTLAAADYDETTVSRTWWSATATDVGSIRPKVVTTTLPAVVTAENGENVAHTRIAYVRENGHTAFVKAEDGIYDYMEYDDGLLVESIRDAKLNETGVFDADPNGVFGIAENGDGWSVTTLYEYDNQGRVTQVTAQEDEAGLDDDVSQIFRTALDDRRLVTISIPRVDTSGTTTYHGPVSISAIDQAGNSNESLLAYSTVSATTTTAPSAWLTESAASLIDALAMWLNDAKNYQLHSFNESGSLLEQSECVIIWSTDSTVSDATTYAYDTMGRLVRMEDASGTINRYSYDVLGRPTMMEVGTDDSGGMDDNMVVLSETEYDDGNDGGNSYVTATTARVEDDATNERVTEFEHDVRGRVIFTKAPLAPHTVVDYDNLGRMVASAQYSSSSGLSASSVPTGTTNRVSYSTVDYDSRGRVWKSVAHEINQSTGASSDTLESRSWFDSVGRLIKVQGGQLTKTFYDRLGRPTDNFIIAITNDTLYAHADGVDGDHVVEQIVTVYESQDSSLVDASAVVQRPHDDTTTTGELDTNADGESRTFTAADIKGRIQISAMWYDDLDRLVTQANYGTFSGATFDRDASAFDTPAEQSDTDAIVTDTVFDNSGSVQESIDPQDIKTRFVYDAMNRITQVIRNYDDGTPDGANQDEKLVADDDLSTWYEYLDGNLILMTADADADGTKDDKGTDQVTRYIYGVGGGGVSGGASEVASNRLLLAVVYPDSTNSATDPTGITSSDADVVTFRYNTQGQVAWRKDQAGNVITTTYDALGRPTVADATAVSPFDGTVDEIRYTYSTRGFLQAVGQYNATNDALDEVAWTHDGWGNITNISQDHDPDSIATGSQHDVAFAYSKSAPSDGRATIRRASMTFPTGYQAKYLTGNSSIPGALARTDQVQIGSGNSFVTVATYDYLGAASLVGTTLPEPDVYSNRFNDSGTYTELDIWNRFSSWTWTKDLNTTDRVFYDVSLAFNDRGDITSTVDGIMQTAGTTTGEFDQLYGLDGLSRLLSMDRGHIASGSITTPEETRDWSLTATGNWATRLYDYDGDSTADYEENNLNPTGPPALGLDDHFNTANEWILRTVTAGGSDAEPDYDGNGNMIDDDEDYVYKYDPWNRLVSISTTGMSPTLVAEYRYNGLGQRISEGDGSDEEFMIYDDSWQLISRYDDSISKYTEEILYHHAGLDGYGGSSPLDSVLLRRTFLTTGTPQTEDERWYILQNWRNDPVVTVTDAGVQVERVHFSPYGEPFGIPAGDVDFDGWASPANASLISAWSSIPGWGYLAYADIDLDGDIDSADASATTAETLGRGDLTFAGSTVGYAGYVQDAYVPTISHVRHRVYKSDLGRWLQRDPVGYVDGPSLYEYAMGAPVKFIDSLGLSVRSGPGGGGMPNVGGPTAAPACGPSPLPDLNPEILPWHPGHMPHFAELQICLSRCEAVHGTRLDQILQQIINIDWLMYVNQCEFFESPYSVEYLWLNATNSPGYQRRRGANNQQVADPLANAAAASVYAGSKEGLGHGSSRMYGGFVAAATHFNGSTAEIAAERAAMAKRLASKGNFAIGGAVVVGETLYFYVQGEHARAVGSGSLGALSLGAAAFTGLRAGMLTGGIVGAAVGVGGAALVAYVEASWIQKRHRVHNEAAHKWHCHHLGHLKWTYGLLGMDEHDALEDCKDGCYEDFFVQ